MYFFLAAAASVVVEASFPALGAAGIAAGCYICFVSDSFSLEDAMLQDVSL